MAVENPEDTKRFLEVINSTNTQAEAARVLGITKQAVNQKLKRLKNQTTQAVVAQPAPVVQGIVQDKLDTIGQLKKTNDAANELLDVCMAWARGDDVSIQVLENTRRKIRLGVKGGNDEDDDGAGVTWVDEFKFKDPREIALKAMAEIRNQLKLQFDIFSTIYSIRSAEDFQNSVIEVIKEINPDAASLIVERLHSKQAIRRIIEQPGQSNGV